MRSVFAAMIMLSASPAVALPAEAPANRPGSGYMQPPVGHRQPTQDDIRGADQAQIEMDNLAAGDNVVGERRSEEDEVGRMIDRENQALDRELGDICRGC